MADDEVDLLAIDQGSVTAPAGCGKTFRIVDALSRHSGRKPVLVLTHTNAGVAALRVRLRRDHVVPASYRLATIDGWGRRLASMFPALSQCEPSVVRLADRSPDYPKLREAAARLLAIGNMQDLVAATYARLLVDEYQDCSTNQHALLTNVAQAVPTCVLGDDMQAIFNFGPDPLPDWNEEVCRSFPVASTLDTPHRWINAGAEDLGRWLLDVRDRLKQSQGVDLRGAPAGVNWVELDGVTDHQRRLAAALTRAPGGVGSVLIVADSHNSENRRLVASQTYGAVTVEAVELRDLVAFAEAFDVTSDDALEKILGFGQRLMTKVGAPQLLGRLEVLRSGRSRKPATVVESAGLAFLAATSYMAAASLLETIRSQPEVRVYRPTVLRACLAALRASGDSGTFADHAIRERERYRATGRPLPARAVGSTLLLKGLEAEVVVILDAVAHDSKNLYVAMTRGSKVVVVCSPTQSLDPR